ncbi:MAG: hypothetical protein DYH05_03930 [Acidobacteria bacterium ACB1]|nr:hypothetical protein [Pyrinomonadaceae bacterium]MCE7961628.1 hypothetical protein [Acidobacteria bacterium ACB1]RIJ96790.1 MAG: hypothetical protein DCC44_00040 [Acidobacteriota bacterium]
MASRPPGLDSRLENTCVYCGCGYGTRDHVPPRILLDEPYPEANLPVVKACHSCNNRISRDEEYLACLIECIICGTTDPAKVSRTKIAQTLERNARLRREIESGRQENDDGSLMWRFEAERVRNVVLKLARGHVAYELSTERLDEPDYVLALPLITMTEEQREAFETVTNETFIGWPEIGSRAFHRIFATSDNQLIHQDWITVQPGRYRYSVHWTGSVVHIVISDYLACIVSWA